MWKELLEDQNTALGDLMAGVAIAVRHHHRRGDSLTIALFLSVLLIAACGLVYELVASALAELSARRQRVPVLDGHRHVPVRDGHRELAVAIHRPRAGRAIRCGRTDGRRRRRLFVDAARFSRSRTRRRFGSRSTRYVVIVGVLVGLEVPLLMRILRDRFDFKDVIVERADVRLSRRARRVARLSDAPRSASGPRPVGDAVRPGERGDRALVDLYCSPRFCRRSARFARRPCLFCVLLGVGMVTAGRITDDAESNIYADDVIFARDTRYQRIVLTAWKDDLRLFLELAPAIQLARRVPVSRSARPSGAVRRCPRRGGCSCSAAETDSRCARFCAIRAWSTSRWSISTR